MVKHLPTMPETRVLSLSWEDALEKVMTTHSSILAWKSHGLRTLVGYSPWGHKESDMTERLHFDSELYSFCVLFATPPVVSCIMPPRNGHILSPVAVIIWPYVVRRSLQMWLNWGFWDREIIVDYPCERKWKRSRSVISDSLWSHGL